MNWINLESEDAIEEIKKESAVKRVLIFLHSPRSSISILMRGLFEREWTESEMEMKAYFVDAAEHPGLSKKIEAEFSTANTFPQVLIIEKKQPIFTASDGGVDVKKIRRFSNLREIN